MRHITKGKPIPEFVSFLEKGPHTNWEAIHDKDKFPGLYRKCRDQILIEEQDCMSGYTEMPLDSEGDIHIDHFRKKGMHWKPNQTFNWDNFIVDSRDDTYGACHKDKRISNFADYDKLINPVEEDPHDYFTYLSNGMIVPKDGLSEEDVVKAEFTRDSFNLQCNFLCTKRLSIMRMVESCLSSLTREEILTALSAQGFTSVIEYVCDNNKE